MAEPKTIIVSNVVVHCAHTKVVSLASLKPNPKNPNQHGPKQVKMLARIIRRSGWRNPIIVSKRSGLIVKGHGRYLAAKQLRLEEVPIDEQDYASDSAETADLLADNQIAELSTLDKQTAAELIKEIEADIDFDIELTGFDDVSISNLFEGLEDLGEEESPNTTEVLEVVLQCDSVTQQKKVLDEMVTAGYKARAQKSKLKGGDE